MLLTLNEVEQVALSALLASGASEAQASSVAASIRDAEAEGTRSIGLGYLSYYCTHLKVGKIIGDAVPMVRRPRPSLIGVDAGGGFAHTAFDAGESAFVSAVEEQGIAMMAIENAYACGVLGYFTRRLAQSGLIGIMTSNTSPVMAAWGGKRPFFGTNPWSLAAPRSGPPLVIDSSSSATAYVNVATAAAGGKPIPETWALDADGNPTTDPAAGLSGTMAPAGGHKGAALALAVEILSAGLTRSDWSHQSSSLLNDEGGPPMLGQSLIAIRPDGFGQGDFAARLDSMLTDMTQEPGTRIPGDRRHANRRRIEQSGIEVDQDLAASLAELGAVF